METMPRAFRFTDEDLALMDWLGRAWGPVKPLDRTTVIRESLKRAKEAEERKKRSKSKTKEAETQ